MTLATPLDLPVILDPKDFLQLVPPASGAKDRRKAIYDIAEPFLKAVDYNGVIAGGAAMHVFHGWEYDDIDIFLPFPRGGLWEAKGFDGNKHAEKLIAAFGPPDAQKIFQNGEKSYAGRAFGWMKWGNVQVVQTYHRGIDDDILSDFDFGFLRRSLHSMLVIPSALNPLIRLTEVSNAWKAYRAIKYVIRGAKIADHCENRILEVCTPGWVDFDVESYFGNVSNQIVAAANPAAYLTAKLLVAQDAPISIDAAIKLGQLKYDANQIIESANGRLDFLLEVL